MHGVTTCGYTCDMHVLLVLYTTYHPCPCSHQVVAMRLMYGLDGQQAPEGGHQPPSSWTDWAHQVLQHCATDNPGLLSTHEVCLRRHAV